MAEMSEMVPYFIHHYNCFKFSMCKKKCHRLALDGVGSMFAFLNLLLFTYLHSYLYLTTTTTTSTAIIMAMSWNPKNLMTSMFIPPRFFPHFSCLSQTASLRLKVTSPYITTSTNTTHYQSHYNHLASSKHISTN